MFDNTLMLINPSANVTATVTGSPVEFPGEDMRELYVGIFVPSKAGTTPKIVATIQESDNGTTGWVTIAAFADITDKGMYVAHPRGKKKYRRAVLTVSGTNPDFGKVKVGVLTSGTYTNW